MGAPGRHVPQECHYAGRGGHYEFANGTPDSRHGLASYCVAIFPPFAILTLGRTLCSQNYSGRWRYHSLLITAESPKDLNTIYIEKKNIK